ncbi:MAG: hypothetical protein JRI25_15865 [Deltaproteobacteria bacterium]|nr:hypothetical protein [Deltaproteobacteria bacterium]
MASKHPSDPADAPSVPRPFKSEEPELDEDSLLDLPTLIPTDETRPSQPPPLAIPKPTAPPAQPRPEPPKSSLAARARRPLSVAEALQAAGRQAPALEEDSAETSAAEVAVLHAIAALFPGARVIRLARVSDRKVFKALWQAHRVRAQADGDHHLAVAASVLLDASTRVPEKHLYAAEIALDDAPRAVWVDADRATLLAVADTAYLAGV